MIDGTAYVLELRRGDQYQALVQNIDLQKKADDPLSAVYRAVEPLLHANLPRRRQ